MNDTLIICLTVVVLAVLFILFCRAKNTYVEEITNTHDWCKANGKVYRRDFTIQRTYHSGKKRVIIKKVYT